MLQDTPDPNALPSGAWKQDLLGEAYTSIASIAGDLAEFGVYNGHNVRTLARLAPDRRVWAFDTFTGMPAEDYLPREDYSDPPGKWASSADPATLFRGYPNVEVRQGRFADTLPLVDPTTLFALVHIDCDWYASHKQVLDFLADGHLVPGALLLLDDPQLPGAQRAISEWVATHPTVTQLSQHKILWQ